MEEKQKEQKAWYLIASYAGMENIALDNLLRRVESMNMEDYFFNFLIPEETHYEKKKNGEVKEYKTKIYPGYIFIEMIVTDETWFMVRNTPNVTGFLGSSGGRTKPVPIPELEMRSILERCGITEEIDFNCVVGDQVKVVAGPFTGFVGKIDSIDMEKQQVKVLIDFFGRSTPTDLGFKDIEK